VSKIQAITDPAAIIDADFVMICVLTPVTKTKDPDLGPVRSATIKVFKNLQPGEIVGIIGRNGARKSTLLKILSRITIPTEGSLELHGQVGYWLR
jgi:ABC-type polysaccharide/polyol phosphate transport system ATPase subunit